MPVTSYTEWLRRFLEKQGINYEQELEVKKQRIERGFRSIVLDAKRKAAEIEKDVGDITRVQQSIRNNYPTLKPVAQATGRPKLYAVR